MTPKDVNGGDIYDTNCALVDDGDGGRPSPRAAPGSVAGLLS